MIPDISWIACFNSCHKVATIGNTFHVTIVNIDRDRNRIAGSHRAIHPESNPWNGAWQIYIGDVLAAKVVRWIEQADRCADAGGYLLALRPGAFVVLCGQQPGCFVQGDECTVRITAVDRHQHQVDVELVT